MGIRRLRAYPPSARPLVVWGWGEDLAPEQVSDGLERLVRFGFGGVIVAPRGRNCMRNFLSPLWREALLATARTASKHSIELWLEVPLGGYGASDLFPQLQSAHSITLRPASSEFLNGCEVLAWYQRDLAGRMRQIGEMEEPPSRPVSAQVALCKRLFDAPDLLNPATAAQFIQHILAPQAQWLSESEHSAFHGFVLGEPPSMEGECWSEPLLAELEQQEFTGILGRAPDLFGESTGGEPAFVHAYRHCGAQLAARHFAQPLAQWANEQHWQIIAPVQSAWDERFPSWVFPREGFLPQVAAGIPEQTLGLEHQVMAGATRPLARISAASVCEGQVGASILYRAAEAVLSAAGGRAILDWLPFLDDSPVDWSAHPCPLNLVMPGLRGLREMVMRLSTWTLIGEMAHRLPRVLVIAPRTSFWRIANEGGGSTCASVAIRGKSMEAMRLKRIFARVQNCLQAMSFDFELWDEYGPTPAGLLPETLQPYQVVILPGILNVQSSTWQALAEFTSAGGKLLALERYPSFVEGLANEDLTEWSRQSIERCETIDQLSSWLEEEIERPVRAISLTRGVEPLAPEVTGMAEDGRITWLAARNADDHASVRGLLEIDGALDLFIDEVDLDTGNLTAASSVERLDDMLSMEVELAPLQVRVFHLQRAPMAEVEAIPVETPPVFAELQLGSDWAVQIADENLYPLSIDHYALNGEPWTSMEECPWAPAGEALIAPKMIKGQAQIRCHFVVEQGPQERLASLLDLGLYFHPSIALRSATLNGATVSASTAATCPRNGLRRVTLPPTVQLGTNELILSVDVTAQNNIWAPWILGGRFGVMPSAQDPNQYLLLACPGQKENLTDLVCSQNNIIDGIWEFAESPRDVESAHLAWLDWRRWPLLRDRKDLADIGLPFYGGLLKIEGSFTLPSRGPTIGHWRRAIFELGPVQASWVALKVNGMLVGSLGLSPFSKDITNFLDPSGRNTISLRVWFSWCQALRAFRTCGYEDGQHIVSKRGFMGLPRVLLLG